MVDDGKVVPLVVVQRVRVVSECVDAGHNLEVIGVLERALERARSGELRSVLIVSIGSDGKSLSTSWAAKTEDLAMRVGMLATLQHDLLSTRE